MQTIGIESLGYRPYVINGKKVVAIHFFNKDGIVVTIQRGWIEAYGLMYKGSNTDIPKFIISKDLTHKRVVNFKDQVPFTITGKEKYSNLSGLHLYLPAEMVNMKYLGERKRLSEDQLSTRIDEQYKITLNCQISEYNKELEKFELTEFKARTIELGVFKENVPNEEKIKKLETFKAMIADKIKHYGNIPDSFYLELMEKFNVTAK